MEWDDGREGRYGRLRSASGSVAGSTRESGGVKVKEVPVGVADGGEL